MRIFSTSIAQMVKTSTVLPESLKGAIAAHDSLHAQIFEAYGASALYCITPGGTRLQFIGTHPQQAVSAKKIIEEMEGEGSIALLAGGVVETARAEDVLTLAAKQSHTVCGDKVFDCAGRCIASGLRVVQEDAIATAYFQPEHGSCESASNLSALRQIAVSEAGQAGLGHSLKKIQLGTVDISWPRRARAANRACTQFMAGLSKITCSPIPIL